MGRQALGFFRQLTEEKPSARAALGPLLDTALGQRGSHVAWDVVAELHDRLDDICDDGETLDDLVACIAESNEMGRLFRLLRLVASPTAVFRLVYKWSGPRIFPHIEVSYEERSDGWIEVELRIPPPHRGCEAFFRLAAAQARALPTLLGMDEAIVEATHDVRAGTYRILPPQTDTLASRLKRAFRSLLFGTHAIRELTEQESRLAVQFRQLQAKCVELEEQRTAAVDAQRRAESALKARRRFLCAINHELRTPLNGIVGALPLLRTADKSAHGELLDAAEASAARLEELVENVLRVAEHAGAVQEGEPRTFALSWLGQDLALAYRPLAEAAGLKLDVDAETDPTIVHADRGSIAGIASCLLDNAIRFTSAGSVTLRVRRDPTTDAAVVEVGDTGPGIPAERIEALFGTEGGKLSWCSKRARELGGELTCDSGREGTTFSFRVPLLRPAAETTAAADPAGTKQVSVLVAEDNEVNRMVIERHLTDLGARVTLTEDGAAAVRAIRAAEYDLVLMDCDMPVLDGYGATRQIRALGIGIPIVAVTAYTAEEDRAECRRSGMDGFVAKPIRRRMLQQVLDGFARGTTLAS